MAGTEIDRRTLIKGAAAAGVAAWTAPVIIDSLSSPAAAGTPAPCTTYYASKNSSGSWGSSPTNGVCNIATEVSQYGASTNPSAYPSGVVSANTSFNKITVPNGCAKFVLVRVHYGASQPCGTCISITTTCSGTVPPTSGCGCLSTDGTIAYFPKQGLSDFAAIWCCAS